MVWAGFIRCLQAPLAVGWRALFVATSAVGLGTIVRTAVNGVVTGCEFTPYLLFILPCAILLPWWVTGLAAVGSLAIMGEFFVGPLNEAVWSACFQTSAGIFLAGSAMTICVAVLTRRAVAVVQ